jgi:PAS domain S-box-containing protein
VLIAHGRADTRSRLERLLGAVYEVEGHGDAAGVLAAVARGPVDLVLADAALPGALDGPGLLRALRADMALSSTAVVLIAAGGVEAPGADAVIAAPFGDDALRAEVAAALDASLRRRVAALRETEERYRAFVANSAEGVYRLEFVPPVDTSRPHDEQIEHICRDGRFAECNDTFARMYGFGRAEEVVGAPLGAMLPPEEPVVRAYLTFAIESGYRVTDVESEERDREGRAVYFANSLWGVVEDGRLVRVWGIQRDVTGRRLAEERLRESEARFRTLAATIPQLIWSATPDGGASYLSDQWTQFTGIPAERLLGDGWQQVVHPEDLPAGQRDWARALRAGEPIELKQRFLHRSGAWRWQLVRGLAVRDAAGRILRWVGTCTDVQREVDAEAALREADRRKDEFLAMLAHELRNPLAPIRTAAEVLKVCEPVGPGVREAREVIERQVQQLARLVDDLLDVSRITRGKVRLETAAVDLASVVARAVETSRPLVEARRHRLETALPDAPVLVRGDLARLVQVIANLLTNAAKFTDAGGEIRLEVTAEGREAVIRVRDDGIGIPAELLPRIFDLFAQGDRALDRSQGGLGIGLTLVRQLVALHGGRVEARSEGPGKGSELVVRLPLSETAEGAPGAPAEDGRRAGGGLRVLVVEDNVDAADMLSLMLRLAGHETRVVHDGASAPDAAVAFLPHVVLCDIGLPGVSGYEVARRLRERPELASTRLVALTGYGQDEDRRRAREAGFDHHFVKPVEPRALEALLATLSASTR